MKIKTKWIVIDWTGRRIFPLKDFKTFEDGWDFISEFMPEDEWQEVLVVENQ